MLVANGAFKWFKRASGLGLIEPDGPVGERVEFEWRDGGMGREAVNVAPSAPNGKQ